MDTDFEDLIEKAFLEGQIDGETMNLAVLHSMNDLPSNILRIVSSESLARALLH